MSKQNRRTGAKQPGLSRRALLGGLGGLLLIAALAILPRLGLLQGSPQLGGPFTLTDHHGKTVTEADYRGKLVLLFFGYTYCPDVCPGELATLAQALDLLSPEEQGRLQILFVSVDPERDSPQQLAAYVAAFSPAITGLTGTRAQLDAMMRSYKVYARKADPNNPESAIDHSALTYLLDGNGKLVRTFPHATQAQVISESIRTALQDEKK